MTTITLSQWNVFTFIQRHMARWGSLPRLADIRAGCGMDSTASAMFVLRDLEAKRLVDVVVRKRNGQNVTYARLKRSVGKVGVAL